MIAIIIDQTWYVELEYGSDEDGYEVKTIMSLQDAENTVSAEWLAKASYITSVEAEKGYGIKFS
jgi:hypothetical protein